MDGRLCELLLHFEKRLFIGYHRQVANPSPNEVDRRKAIEIFQNYNFSAAGHTGIDMAALRSVGDPRRVGSSKFDYSIPNMHRTFDREWEMMNRFVSHLMIKIFCLLLTGF
jgi:hypothetical protein